MSQNRAAVQWRATYEHLQEQAIEAEMLADEAFAMRAEHLLTRIDNFESKTKGRL